MIHQYHPEEYIFYLFSIKDKYFTNLIYWENKDVHLYYAKRRFYEMTLFIGSLQLGLIYGLLALGIYITFRILNIPDLTADGSFTLGLAVSAMFTIAGHPVSGLLMATLAGTLAGSITGFLQAKINIHPILAGIITMSGLYSVNLFIMGTTSNITLIGSDSIFTILGNSFQEANNNAIKTILALFLCFGMFALLSLFFKTHLGLSIRATGDNEDMVRASSINVNTTKMITLAISNGCIGLSGSIIAQYQGFADISSGTGTMITGLASVIIGEVLFRGKTSVTRGLLAAIIGSMIYRLIIALALSSSLFPAYMLKLVSAIIVAIALSLPTIKSQRTFYKMKKKVTKNA